MDWRLLCPIRLVLARLFSVVAVSFSSAFFVLTLPADPMIKERHDSERILFT